DHAVQSGRERDADGALIVVVIRGGFRRCRHGEVRGGDEPEGESEDDGAARKAWRARASAGSGADQRLWSSSGAGGGEPVSSDPAILGGCHRGCLKARRVTAVSDALPPTPDPALVS